MVEAVPTIDRYKKRFVIGCVLILIGIVLSLVINSLYAYQLYDLSRKREEEDMSYDEYNLKRGEVSLWYSYGRYITKAIVTGGCFIGVFTCLTLFFNRKILLEGTERLGLLILTGFLLLIALWYDGSFLSIIPYLY